jgi:hypothetical protein
MDEIHDTSRVDSFMASRRRAMIFHSVWKPMLAGAVGAALIVATVWAAMPKFHYNDVEIPRVTVSDVTVDHVVPRDVPVDHVVPHDVPVDRLILPPPKPVADARPPMGPDSPYAAKTPEENKFVDKPEYRNATYHGRIVKSRDGHELSFEDGKNFHPAHWDNATGKMVYDTDQTILSDEFIGDLGMCTPETGHDGMWNCVAMHNGVETPLGGSQPINTSATPTTAAANMVAVDIKVGGYPVEAMVDTGCAWPMAVPKVYADALVRVGLAIRAGASSTTFADGSTHDVGIIMINAINVDGRVLHDVEASVSPSDAAPILLGLGALNRLGPYSIQEGRLVFTGEQPA